MVETASRPAVVSRSAGQTFLLSCGIIGSILFVGTYLIEGALHPGFDLMRQTISSLELVSNGWTQQVNFIVFALFLILFAVGLWRELAPDFWGRAFALLVGLAAVGLIISGIFVHEPQHTTGDFITFLSIVFSFFVIAVSFIRAPHWGWGWVVYSILSALLMMGLLAAFGSALGHGGPAGLLERLAGLVRSIWTIIFVGRLLAGVKLAPRK